MNTPQVVLEAVQREQAYATNKWGAKARSLLAWVLIMEKEIQEAKLAYTDLEDEGEIQQEILQAIASGFSCLQEHGVVERPEVRPAIHQKELANASTD